MTIQEAVELIGKPIYVYEVYETTTVGDFLSNKKQFTYAIYESKIIMVGKDFVYDDDSSLKDIGRTHYFDEYNETWFTDKDLCEQAVKNEIEEMNYDK